MLIREAGYIAGGTEALNIKNYAIIVAYRFLNPKWILVHF
jgi:hypothetical protein